MLRIAFLVSLALVACGTSDDPFTKDMKQICNPRLDPNVPPDMAKMKAFRDIADHIKTPEAARLMSELIQAAPGDRPAILAPALAKAKLKRCPFLED